MIKIICTSEKEKRELIEAAELLSRLKVDSKLSGVNFLMNLHRNPGDIEVTEQIVVRRTKDYETQKKFTKSRW